MDPIHIFTLEASEDGGGGPAPAGDPAAVAPEPIAPEAAPPDGAPPVDPVQTGGDSITLSRAELESFLAEELDARLAAQQYAPPIPGATPGPMAQGFDPTALDPYSEDFGQNLLAAMQGIVQQAISPVAQTFEQQAYQAQIAQGEQYAQDIIADALASGADVSDAGKEAIRPFAEAFMPQAVKRYGESPRAAEMAIHMAIDHVRSIEKAAAERALAQHTNYTASLAGAPAGEPGGAPSAAVPGQPQKYLSPDELVARHARIRAV